MASFCLLHGAWHGAWCFEQLTPYLTAAGHRVHAVELPSDQPGTTCTEYAEQVSGELEELGKDAILVGHSFAGLTLPLVAARQPLGHLVYIGALIPKPGVSMSQQFEAGEEAIIFDGGRELNEEESLSYWTDRDAAIDSMYHDCERRDAEWAWSNLRPQSRAAQDEVCPLQELPDIPSTFIVCRDDRLASAKWGRERARDRLRADVVELDGGHSPMLSRPGELAELLVQLR
jgi:pimeloyl-ACP methyl ester carboxylesterase